MRIAEYVPGATHWGSVNPQALESGLGGRETAAVRLALAWAEAGHEVLVFCDTEGMNVGSASFLPLDRAVPVMTSIGFDAILSWEDPSLFTNPAVRASCPALLCGMQVAHVPPQGALDAPDAWVALSDWHRLFLTEQLGPGALIYVQPNGVALDLFDATEPSASPRLKFIYASSPDRGLHHLAEAWPLIRKDFPDSELHVCYGAKQWAEQARWLHNVMGEMALAIEQLLCMPGVVDHGRIGQRELAQLYLDCDALLYPCDTLAPTETGCITVIEACAAGCVPLITDCDCLGSEFYEVAEVVPLPWDAERYVKRLSYLISSNSEREQLRRVGRAFAEQRDWAKIAPGWLDLFRLIGQATGRRGRAA